MRTINYPPEFLERMRALRGAEYEAFARALSEAPVKSLRMNPQKTPDGWTPGEEAVEWEPMGRYLAEDFKPGRDILHFAGAYYMQEASAMAPARILNPEPGERILDLCAAPGGKSGQIASMMNGLGALVSNEPDFPRAKILESNLERLGVSNRMVVCSPPEKLAERWAGEFDGVLVDAPCSGEGMFRKDAAARSEWSEKSGEGCAARQKKILAAAARMVAPGGRLCYSTCTLNESENEENARWFLSQHPDFYPADFSLPGVGKSRAGTIRLWPDRVRGEGHFAALFVKRGERARRASLRRATDRAAEAALEALKKEIPGNWLSNFPGFEARLSGDRLFLAPGLLPDADGLKTLSRGVESASVGKGFVKPAHALAMAIAPGLVGRRIDLDEADARKYLRGETLAGDISGWTLITHRGLSLGWGKGSDGQIKNHLPKGLRMNGSF